MNSNSQYSVPGIRLVMPYLIALLSTLLPVSVQATDPEPVYYQDCAYIEFDDIDNDALTRNEEIALIDENFFAALDRSAECMNSAAATGAGKIGDAAGNAGGGQGAAGGQSGNAGSSGQASGSGSPVPIAEQQQNPQQTTDTTKGIDTQRGTSSGGSSAVCDAVKEGLASATTQAEKEHWQGLAAEYGCQS
ncbi:hypothetical protein [Alteromonas halophila]|uniref:Uncharacterized protein n=1 Tax=Alteromonas halophila TaxID=516698 RepID=A0A918JHB4_9ALTE|nr:hypothetical protein [Alteromonas halophila]GGW81474.1 hypothetical protein GCM10007391_13320 [Alteromonas halophila]